MAKQTGPKCRICRREGVRLFLKGARCLTPKCAMVRKNYIPGAHGDKTRKPRLSEYGLHLREKQKLRRTYGILERQFRNYYTKAASKKGVTGDILFQMLESRLDNVIYRASFASSRSQARQLTSHSFFKVNGRKVNLPSYGVRKEDKIVFTKRAQKSRYFKDLQLPKKQSSAWLRIDTKNREIKVLREPTARDVDQSVDMALIVEYYSR